MRFLLYAAIGLAVTGLGARRAFRGLVAVFYVGTFVETLFAVYYVATGTSQTASASLSTGGSRALALSTAIYLAGALVLAILNVELNRGRGRVGLHAAVACLAVIDIGLSLGRTTFAAVGVILPVLVLGLRHARRTLLSYVPLLLPLLVLFVIALLLIDPSLGSTLGDRLTGHLSNDNAVVERTREVDATLAGLNHHLSLGFGFGRPVSWLNTDGVTIRHSSGGSENSYVWLLAGGGVFAFVSFLFVILAYFADGFRRLRSAVDEARALVIFSLSMAFILLVNAITGPVLSDPTMLMTVWVAFMLPAAVRPPDAAP
jgi:hypothetical protein